MLTDHLFVSSLLHDIHFSDVQILKHSKECICAVAVADELHIQNTQNPKRENTTVLTETQTQKVQRKSKSHNTNVWFSN